MPYILLQKQYLTIVLIRKILLFFKYLQLEFTDFRGRLYNLSGHRLINPSKITNFATPIITVAVGERNFILISVKYLVAPAAGAE
jgi:hypothetical protein